MIVKQIELSNFKTIKDFKAEFEGNVYLITGENEIGKSTLINAIGILLTGDRSDNLLKLGEEKGYAKMTVGQGESSYVVELRFSDKNPRGTLTISQEGTLMRSDRKSALESIFKYQDFDAHEFLRWSETAEGRRRQVEVVKSLLPKEIQEELNKIDSDVAQAMEDRKVLSSQMKVFEVTVKNQFVSPEEIEQYKEPIDVNELIKKEDDLATENNKIAQVSHRVTVRVEEIKRVDSDIEKTKADWETSIEDIDSEIKRLQERKSRISEAANEKDMQLKKSKADLEKQNKEAAKWLKENQPKDLTEVKEKIKESSKHNEMNAKVKEYSKAFSELQKLADNHSTLEGKIASLRAKKDELIHAADLPVKGLDFTEEGITLNGIPFKPGEVSTSQEMEVAVSLIIAKNPTTKVFRVAQGESLGSAKLKAIVDFAKKRGYQGFIEEVVRGQQELIVHEYKEHDSTQG